MLPSDVIINEKEIFLYSAMHRVGNIPLTKKFLEIDTINLSMPIILSNSTDIELRIKAAHLAYYNGILNTDSLAALYQIVDFSSQELSDIKNISKKINENIEIGMAYYYQLINMQLLPITRIEAIINFINFAKRNNLELVAYKLSQKGLNTIDPSNELSEYGAEIARAYVHSEILKKLKNGSYFLKNQIMN